MIQYRHIPTSIWDDDRWTSLVIEDQWALLMLTTSTDLKADGFADYTPRRWSRLAPDATAENVHQSFTALHAAGWARLDLDAEEVFLPNFYAWERIGGQPRRVAGVWDLIDTRHSLELRAAAQDALMTEVARASTSARPLDGGRAFVFERDGWRCTSCGWAPGDDVPITATGRPLHRELEVDHIFPKSKGGVDGPDNFQTLCTTCNTRKGARVE